MRVTSAVPALFASALAALAAGCFKNPQPECAFACDPGGTSGSQACPTGYSCRPDGLCKLDGVADSFACPDVSGGDAARVDAADVDAASIDAPAIDAPTIDAPMIDAPTDAAIDAAVDASVAMLAITTGAPLEFGTVTVGMNDTRTVTVRNDGMSTSSVLVVSITGDVTEFTLVVGASDTCTGQTLDASETCTFEVRFAPTSAGAKAATVTVTAATGGMPSLAVTGTGQT